MNKTPGQRAADEMVKIVPNDNLGGIALHFGRDMICWEVKGTGKLEKDADAMRRYIAYKIDKAFQDGKRAGEAAERELSARGKKTTMEEVRRMKADAKHFRQFAKNVREFIERLDVVIMKPPRVERGREIARLCNALDMCTERIELFVTNTKPLGSGLAAKKTKGQQEEKS